MYFSLLGPFIAADQGRPLPMGGPFSRGTLAVLLLHRNQAVSVDRLTWALWGDRPPRLATASLRNHVMRLRNTLGDAGAQRIRTGSSSYEMRVEPDECDLDVFARECAEGLTAVREQRWAAASSVLTSALSLWRGEPLADLPTLNGFEDQVQRLRNDRLVAYEGRIEADLQLGRPVEAAKELLPLVAENPLHEPFHRQLMLALYRSGRQAEALETYRALRRTLVAELGVEPSAEIRELHQRILAGHPDPVTPAPAAVSVTAAPGPGPEREPEPEAGPTPIAQLPADVADFTGRERETAETVRVLTAGTAAPGRVPIAVLAGGGGLGKTTLAVHAAHRVAHAYPDGQLYVDLRGVNPTPRTAADVLASFLTAMGIPAGGIPADVDERAALFRSALNGRRFLVVLDNARDPAQIRPLIPASDGCAVLVTSRSKLSGLAGAHRVELDLLPSAAAIALLEHIIGTERVLAEPVAVASIVDSCAGLPLALRITGARLADRPAWSLERFAARLADRRRRLDELSVSDLAVRACFDLTHAYLLTRQDGPGRAAGADAAEVFRMATLIPAPTFGAEEVVALLGDRRAEAADVEDALEHLVNIHLLAVEGDGCYRFHDLIRSYAVELLEATETPEQRERAMRRLVCWYAAAVEAASRSIGNAYVALSSDKPEPGTPDPPSFADDDAAAAWCARYYDALSGAVDIAAGCGREDAAPRIAVHLMAYAMVAMTPAWGDCLERALAVAHDHGDVRAQAWVRHRLGTFHGLWQHPEECVRITAEALAGHRAVGDRTGEILDLGNLASAYGLAGESERALDYARQTLARLAQWPELDVNHRSAQVLIAMADAYLSLNRYEEAAEHYRRAAASYDPDDRSHNHAVSLNNLGDAYRALGMFDEAVASIERSLHLSVRANNRHLQGDSLDTLGRVFAHFGDADRARDCFKRSLEIFDEIGFAPGAARVVEHLGDVGG